MEKLLSKKIRELICEDDETKYIKNVKNCIYFISQIIYMYKFIFSHEIIKDEKCFFKNKELFDEKSVLIFKQYNEFNFDNNIYEEKIFNIIKEIKYNDIISINISKLYENLISEKERKILGQVYTPSSIIESMIKVAFENTEINLNTKILDPSCGGGYFLIKIFKKIREYFYENKILCGDCTEKYILENMIYGVDIDKFSTFLTKISLMFELNFPDIDLNIFESDFLIDFSHKDKFDIIIGNPPYIGHKNIGIEYRKKLKNKYNEVFYDKSDISYCFFKAGNDLLKENGTICFITSRYFLEAKYADKLREYIEENLDIIKIFDYNGSRAFKNAIVSPAIILLSKKIYNSSKIEVEKYDSIENKFISFEVEKKDLSRNGWVLMDAKYRKLYEKIYSKCNFKLKDLGSIKQGIITGYDKAFIVTDSEIKENNFEKILLKKWIKNSNITNGKINYSGIYVLYTNLIDDETNYPNTIKYLQRYRERLEKRRECKSGIRKWYDLQWGRNLSLFENKKIIFPYKSKKNNFYYDKEAYLCSADIYSLVINEEMVSYMYMVNYLNSSIFEFLFKNNAKKVGEKLYEYYPNKLETMGIFVPESIPEINNDYSKIYVENYLEKMFNITCDEKNLMEEFIRD